MSNEIMNLINQAKLQARSENIAKFISRNGKNILRFAIALVFVAIALALFNSYQKFNQEKFSTILHQSLINQQIGEVEKAKADLKKIVDSGSAPSGVKSLASLRYAAFLLEEGNKAEAVKLYLDVNNCRSCDNYIRDLAGLLAVKTWMSDEEEIRKSDLEERIKKIEDHAKILHHHIAEQRALLELQKNNLEKSYQIFEQIAAAKEVSQPLKARAEDGMKMAVSKGFEPKVADKK